jgi:hypothetical protein
VEEDQVMRLGFLTLIATIVPAVLTAAESESPPSKAPPPASAANEALLEKKLAELKTLQAEIRQLRKERASEPQLLICVQMLEVSRQQWDKARLNVGGVTSEPVGGIKNLTAPSDHSRRQIEAGMLLDRDQLQERLTQWREQGAVKVIAEPKLVTVSGRPAQFAVGGVLPIPEKAKNWPHREYGTRIDVVAIARDDGTVRLDLRARQSCLDSRHEITVDGQKVPGLLVQEIDTAAKLLPSQVLVAGVFTRNRSDVDRSAEAAASERDESGGKVAFVVLAQVELIDNLPSSMDSDKGEFSQGEHGQAKTPSASARRRKRR